MKTVRLMAIGFQELIEGFMQFVDIVRDHVGQIGVFGLVPHVFDRIKVRGVCGKPFDGEPLNTVLQQLSDGRSMGRQTVTHEDERTPQVEVNLSQEPDEVRSSCVVVKQFVVQAKPVGPGRASNRSQSRDPIVTIPDSLDRCVSRRSPHSPPQGLEQIATFIKKNQASLPFEALFLAAANSRGSSERLRLRSARALAVSVSADSNRADAANVAHRWGGTPRQKDAGSCRVPAARSTPTARIPNAVSLASVRQPIRIAGDSKASVFGPDGVSQATRHRGAKPPSIDVPKTHSHLPQQLLPLMSFPARTAGLRFSGESRALRDFLMVSYSYRSGSSPIFHYQCKTQ